MQGQLPYVALLPKFRVSCYYSPVLVMDGRPKSSVSLVKCTADPPITVRSRSPKVCETLGLRLSGIRFRDAMGRIIPWESDLRQAQISAERPAR